MSEDIKKKLPIQPIVENRFVENKIVSYLLDKGGIDMNKLAIMDFPDDDRSQFAQLIGYSVSGWSTLSYVRDEEYDTVMALSDENKELEIRNEVLRATINELRVSIKSAALTLFKIHEDDLIS